MALAVFLMSCADMPLAPTGQETQPADPPRTGEGSAPGGSGEGEASAPPEGQEEDGTEEEQEQDQDQDGMGEQEGTDEQEADVEEQEVEEQDQEQGEEGGASTSENPLSGARFYVEPNSNARRQIEDWRHSRPADAAALERIAAQPQVIWFGDWNPSPHDWVRQVTTRIVEAGALPVYALYNIPQRDCGLYSSGGAGDAGQYRWWISEVARAIGSRRAVVVLEPDAVAGLDCLSPADQAARLEMIRAAVGILKTSGSIAVYIDAGNARWHPPAVIADRLAGAGIAEADGFALNVSNFIANEESVRYGNELSPLVGDRHFVVDTSRNGIGPTAEYEWCNPAGRALGVPATSRTGHARVDAFLWIKAPGESDGECNGGPRAGMWWPEYALGLAERAPW